MSVQVERVLEVDLGTNTVNVYFSRTENDAQRAEALIRRFASTLLDGAPTDDIVYRQGTVVLAWSKSASETESAVIAGCLTGEPPDGVTLETPVGTPLSEEDAIRIAIEAVDFEPDPTQTQVRLLREGVSFDPRWFVGLAETGPDGEPTNPTVVEIDATSGEVISVRQP